MYGQDRVAGVVRFEIERLQLGVLELFAERNQGLVEVPVDVLALLGQFEKDVEVLLLLIEGAQELDFAIEAFFILLKGLGPFLVLPDFGRAKFAAEGFYPGFLPLEVKETPEAPRIWRSARGLWLRDRRNARRRCCWGSWASL